jgi:ABC-type lipoprotein export system ATPase subunit
MDKYAIVSENLVKIYRAAGIEVPALQGLDLRVERGEIMAIVGSSGSGKTTLLNMIGGLDLPSAGRLYVCGKDLLKLKAAELVEYKRNTVGFVWRNGARNLLPCLSAAENVAMPMRFARKMVNGKLRRAIGLLDLVELKSRAKSGLSRLSGGEQQRVAIAIALANDPEVLLADEPTGSVDAGTSAGILDMFRRINRELGTTVLIFTHDREIAGKVNRVVSIRDGKAASEKIAAKSELSDASFGGVRREEFFAVDKAGGVQIPPEYLEKLRIKHGKVRVTAEEGRLVISAPDRV